jgi:hypothetical protein
MAGDIGRRLLEFEHEVNSRLESDSSDDDGDEDEDGLDETEGEREDKHLLAVDQDYNRGQQVRPGSKLYAPRSKLKRDWSDKYKPACFHVLLQVPCPGEGVCLGHGNNSLRDLHEAGVRLLSESAGQDDKSRARRKTLHQSLDKLEQRMREKQIHVPMSRTLRTQAEQPRRDPPKRPGGESTNAVREARVSKGMAPRRSDQVVKKHQFSKNLASLDEVDLHELVKQKHVFGDGIKKMDDRAYQAQLAAMISDDRCTQVFAVETERLSDPVLRRLFNPET